MYQKQMVMRLSHPLCPWSCQRPTFRQAWISEGKATLCTLANHYYLLSNKSVQFFSLKFLYSKSCVCGCVCFLNIVDLQCASWQMKVALSLVGSFHFMRNKACYFCMLSTEMIFNWKRFSVIVLRMKQFVIFS